MGSRDTLLVLDGTAIGSLIRHGDLKHPRLP
jgi:hypothetical protein